MLRSARPFCREPSAIGFVDEARLGELKDLVDTERADDLTLTRNNLDHAFQHQTVQCLVDRCAADTDHCGEPRFVDIFPWFKAQVTMRSLIVS